MHFFLEVVLFTVGFFLAYRSGWKAGLTRGISIQLKVLLTKVRDMDERKEGEEEKERKEK